MPRFATARRSIAWVRERSGRRKKHANSKKLSDATHFVTESRKIMVKKYGEQNAVQAVIPSGDVVLYVFGRTH